LDFDTETFVVAPPQNQSVTPRECERLQGFPDDYTLVNYRGKPSSDAPRYRALGNSMAVPVVEWIMRRIQVMDGIKEAMQ
jgi:DNA (cytosine-5)-methyltransferase 1